MDAASSKKKKPRSPGSAVQHAGSAPRAASAGAAPTQQRAANKLTQPTESAPQFVKGADASADALRAHADDLSSDDELPKNTVGNIPMKWYAEYDHIGYSADGKKISKRAGRDGMDRFLASQDDPHYKWTIYDEENDEEVVLSKRDVQLVQRIHSGTFAHPEFDPYPDAIEVFNDKVEQFALNADDEPKRRFIPSKWEMMKVLRMAKAIKEGRCQRQPAKGTVKPALYALWGDDDRAVDFDPRKKAPPPIAAPKLPLPGHAASYNPPPEYLFTDAEREAWEAMDPAKRPIDFIPRRFTSLRQVPLYAPGVRERFERCLDLYLCPRLSRKKLDVNPEDLLPKLPDPAELRPFPTHIALSYEGHGGRVRTLSVDPTGQWLATGSDDGHVRLWKVTTGRCVRTWAMPGSTSATSAAAPGGSATSSGEGGAAPAAAVVRCVAWCPDPSIQVIAVVAGAALHLIYPGTCTAETAQSTFDALTGSRRGAGTAAAVAGSSAAAVKPPDDEDDEDEGTTDEEDAGRGSSAAAAAAAAEAAAGCVWRQAPGLTSAAVLLPGLGRSPAEAAAWSGIKVTVAHPHDPRHVAWHRKGDYLVTSAAATAPDAVQVHQLSRHASQAPFSKSLGQPQAAAFHPRKPLLYVANQRTVRVYDLTKQALEQKLESGVKWISSLDIHPDGDHVVLASYDHRTVWFDTELSARPYKTLRYHAKAVRRAAFHPGGYPLMATASDDGTVHVFHARVFSDYAQNPLIVPVKILRGHTVTPGDELGCLDVAWHPTQPWLFSAGADRQVHLWHNLL